MTYDEFIAEYYKVSAKAVKLSDKARKEGILALEDEIDSDKIDLRDVFELGLRFIVDGTDREVVKDILSNFIMHEEDKYTRLIMDIKVAAVLSILDGENIYITACRLNSYTNIAFKDDPVFKKFMDESDERGTLSDFEIDTLIKDIKLFISKNNDFEELGTLCNSFMQDLIKNIDDNNIFAKALIGTKKETIKAVLRNMRKVDAGKLIEKIKKMDTISSKDVKEAQKQIVKIMKNIMVI